MEAENHAILTDTYPQHPLSKQPRPYFNQKELFDKRKQVDVQKLEADKKKWDEANPATVDQKLIVSEFYVDHPNHTSITTVK